MIVKQGLAMSDLPSYKTPPLEEVAFGCQFMAIDSWRIPHTGKLWDLFSNEYPVVEHASTVASDGLYPPIDNVTGLPLPRVWFINPIESRLIQFQTDRFHYNWRKKEGEPIYPRYEELISKFSTYLSVLEKFISENRLGLIQPMSYELTYINHIYRDTSKSLFEQIESIFPDLNWVKKTQRFLPEPEKFAWTSSFPMPEGNGNLSIRLSQGKLLSENIDLIVLDLTAKGINPSKSLSDHKAWFNLAHEYIVKSFTDMTHEKMQTENWGREK